MGKLAWLVGVLLLLVPSQAWAATFNVQCPTAEAFRSSFLAALNTANANGDDDVIDIGACQGSFLTADNGGGSPGGNALPIIRPDGGHQLVIRTSLGGALGVADLDSRLMELSPGARVLLDGLVLGGGVMGGLRDFDGGIILVHDDAELVVQQCTIYGAWVNHGGAIDSRGALRIERSGFLTGRVAAEGGAIRQTGGSADLVNVTIDSNIAGPHGGAFAAVDGATVTLRHVTISSNSSFDSTGVGLFVSSDSFAKVTNSLIATNATQDPEFVLHYHDVDGAVVDGGGNVFGTGATGRTELSKAGTLTDPLDAKLTTANPYGRFGIVPLTTPILADSPAIDAGIASACAPTDEEGSSRNPLYCDSGAFELNPWMSLSAGSSTYRAGDVVHLTVTSFLVPWVTGVIRLYEGDDLVELARLEEKRDASGLAFAEDHRQDTSFDMLLRTGGKHVFRVLFESDIGKYPGAGSDPFVVDVLPAETDGGLVTTAAPVTSAPTAGAPVSAAPLPSYDAGGGGCGCGLAERGSERAGLLALAALGLVLARRRRAPCVRT